MKLATSSVHRGAVDSSETEGFQGFAAAPSALPIAHPYIESVGHISRSANQSRGGARLSANRQSKNLRLDAAVKFLQAADFSQRLEMPFTRFVTIHWERAGLEDAQVACAMGKLTKLMSDWCCQRSAAVLWAWVRENGPGVGTHAHMLVACSPDLPVPRMWRRWIRRITGKTYRNGVVRTITIGGRLSAPTDNPVLFRQNLIKTSAYCCKGIRSEHQDLLRGQSDLRP